MSRIFIDGFEDAEDLSDDLYLWDTATGSLFAHAGVPGATGNFSCKILSGAELGKELSPLSTVYIGLKIRVTSTANLQIRFRDASDNIQGWIYVDGTSLYNWNIYIKRDDGENEAIVAYTSYEANGWVHLQVKFENVDDTDKNVQVRLDGAAKANVSYSNTNADSATTAKLVFDSDSSDIWIDDVAIDDAEWVGETAIYLLSPDADGTTNEWSPSTGSDNYAMVDEVPAGTGDYVETDTVDDLELYGLADLPVSNEDIKCIQADAYVSVVSGEYVQLSTHVAGTTYLSPSQPAGEAYSHVTYMWDENPNISGEWTEAVVNALEAGFKLVSG